MKKDIDLTWAELQSLGGDLNKASDEYNKIIEEFEEKLRKLNLGVSVWVPTDFEYAPAFHWYLGYTRDESQWGIYLTPGPEKLTNQLVYDSERGYRLTAAPRKLRLLVSPHFIDLLWELRNEITKLLPQVEEAKKIASDLLGQLK